MTAPHSLTQYPVMSNSITQSDIVFYNQWLHHTVWRCILQSVTDWLTASVWRCIVQSVTASHSLTYPTVSDSTSLTMYCTICDWPTVSKCILQSVTAKHSLTLYSAINDCTTQSDTVFYNQWLHHTVWRCILQSVTASHSFSDAVLYNHWCVIQSATVSYDISYNQWLHHTVSPTQCHSIGDCTRLQRSIKQLPSQVHHTICHCTIRSLTLNHMTR